MGGSSCQCGDSRRVSNPASQAANVFGSDTCVGSHAWDGGNHRRGCRLISSDRRIRAPNLLALHERREKLTNDPTAPGGASPKSTSLQCPGSPSLHPPPATTAVAFSSRPHLRFPSQEKAGAGAGPGAGASVADDRRGCCDCGCGCWLQPTLHQLSNVSAGRSKASGPRARERRDLLQRHRLGRFGVVVIVVVFVRSPSSIWAFFHPSRRRRGIRPLSPPWRSMKDHDSRGRTGVRRDPRPSHGFIPRWRPYRRRRPSIRPSVDRPW